MAISGLCQQHGLQQWRLNAKPDLIFTESLFISLCLLFSFILATAICYFCRSWPTAFISLSALSSTDAWWHIGCSFLWNFPPVVQLPYYSHFGLILPTLGWVYHNSPDFLAHWSLQDAIWGSCLIFSGSSSQHSAKTRPKFVLDFVSAF